MLCWLQAISSYMITNNNKYEQTIHVRIIKTHKNKKKYITKNDNPHHHHHQQTKQKQNVKIIDTKH